MKRFAFFGLLIGLGFSGSAFSEIRDVRVGVPASSITEALFFGPATPVRRGMTWSFGISPGWSPRNLTLPSRGASAEAFLGTVLPRFSLTVRQVPLNVGIGELFTDLGVGYTLLNRNGTVVFNNVVQRVEQRAGWATAVLGLSFHPAFLNFAYASTRIYIHANPSFLFVQESPLSNGSSGFGVTGRVGFQQNLSLGLLSSAWKNLSLGFGVSSTFGSVGGGNLSGVSGDLALEFQL